MEAPSSFHLILLHPHNPQSITRYFQHHHPHKYHYWICDPRDCGCYSSISYILPIELEVSGPTGSMKMKKKKNGKWKKKLKMKIKIFQFIKRFEFHPDINCLPLLSSPLLLKRLNHHSVLLLASRTTNLVGLRKSRSLAE